MDDHVSGVNKERQNCAKRSSVTNLSQRIIKTKFVIISTFFLKVTLSKATVPIKVYRMVHIMFYPITWAPISGRQITNQFGGLCQGCDEATLPEV